MNGVVGWFEQRGEIPLLPPPGLREYAPLVDDPDRFDPESAVSTISGVAFGIEYCDSHGWASTRTIRCLSINPLHPAFVTAYCHVRDEIHTFRVDRIISLIDLRSGRMVSGDGHIALLAPYLPEDESRLYLKPLIRVQEATRDGVLALLHIAMMDGRLGDAAREVVIGYIRQEAEASGRTLPSIGLIELWIDNLAPSFDAVSRAIEALLGEKDKFVRLLPWLLKVVRTQDGFIEQEEAVRELIAAVRQHFRRKMYDWPADLRATK
jgi:hypothetical protein